MKTKIEIILNRKMDLLTFLESVETRQIKNDFTSTNSKCEVIINKNDKCPQCNITLIKTKEEGMLLCTSCSELYPWGFDSDFVSRESTNSPQDIISTINIDSKKQQERRTENDFIGYITGNIIGVTKSIGIEAMNIYLKIQQRDIKRGDVRKSIMAACLYELCKSKGIHYKPIQIATLFNIGRSDLSDGVKQLYDYMQKGVVVFPVVKETNNADIIISNEEEKKIYAILNKYFEVLDIQRDNLLVFAYKCVKFLIKYELFNKSIPTTKCAGVIYILSHAKNLGITKKDLSVKCAIAVNTFTKFVNELINFLQPSIAYGPVNRKKCSRLNHLFKKFNIEIPPYKFKL